MKIENNVKINASKLKDITNASDTSAVVMTFLSLRERPREFSNLSMMRRHLRKMGESIVEDDFVKFWKDLQSIGAGVVVYGRRGRALRFRWHYSLTALSKAAIVGKEELVQSLVKKRAAKLEQPTINLVKTNKHESTVYSIEIRKGVTAQVILPLGLTKWDVEAVKRALQA